MEFCKEATRDLSSSVYPPFFSEMHGVSAFDQKNRARVL